jgi:succinyl-diaminopimelate desuccinylase
VVPDRVEVVCNHRFAPDRTIDEALAHVRSVIEPHLGPDDTIDVEDAAPAGLPAVDHPLLAGLIEDEGLEVRAKLGWTDVARFGALGIPAANLGPGDPLLAHTADESVDRAALEQVRRALRRLLAPPD